MALAALLAVSGCIADGPGGSPLGVAFAGKEDDAAGDDDARQVAATQETDAKSGGVKKADRVIAAREARKSAETGTISGSAAIDRMIVQHAKENGIPPALAFAVVRVESRYNPRARGAGVYGLSQIKPATARSLGFSGSASDLLDADTNLTYGMKYLKGAWEQSGHDVCGTAMKYKGGHRTTRMTAAARSYCSKVKAHMAELDVARRGPGEAVPARIETTRIAERAPAAEDAATVASAGRAASRQQAERRGGAAASLVQATAFAPAAGGPAAATTVTDAERSAPVEAVPRSIKVTVEHDRPDVASTRGGRVAAGAKKVPTPAEAPADGTRERDENLAARFGDGDAAVPTLRPSLAD
ncbi:lytic transglycosylase domain-containing protein [Jiella sonneratiae]|uniref:Transglycosylase SLT domain-containing protein n=1 Tax=Jiella sonneratiae TaxID=2816856 RepID=A0ABS3IYJ8_9HYPH|nr:transglycosylase SLT domain-containing protein [Jiella sonneratiae]MBO0902480.1 transglycosylase SLT domain-containing protein [Jiella sonneratiae]